MIVQFVIVEDGKLLAPIEYEFGDARVPCEGERIEADGSEGGFPRGLYRVDWVYWIVTEREPQARIYLIHAGPRT